MSNDPEQRGLSPASDKWWKKHGISLAVREGRPYTRYTADNVEPVRKEYRDLPQRGQRSFMTRVATDGLWWESDDEEERKHQKAWVPRKCDGWLIKRRPPPDLGLDPIFAELRPDANAVRTGPTDWHAHPDEESGEPLICPADSPWSGEELKEWRIFGAGMMRRNGHIGRGKHPDDHCGVNTDEVHPHVPAGKYIFPPTPKIDVDVQHDHNEAFSTKSRERDKTPDEARRAFARKQRARRAAHLTSKQSVTRTQHNGGDLVGPHTHTYRVNDPAVNYAARLDMHPLAVERVRDAEVVYLGIEGCLKADAILTAIIETGEKATVVSVPSVTLWGTPYDDLERFARAHLKDKHTVIVPDADWADKPEVYTQAMFCRSFLRNGIRGLKLSAHVAAPPRESGQKGVDDYLGAGGTLDELDVIDREPAPGIDKWVEEQQWPADWQPKTRSAAIMMLDALALHAGRREKEGDGELFRSLGAFARIFRVSEKEVRRTQDELEELGAIEIEGKRDVTEETWHEGKRFPPGKWYSGRFISGLDYVDRPIIRLKEDLRAGELTHTPLGEARNDWTIPSNDAIEQWVELVARKGTSLTREEGRRMLTDMKHGIISSPYMLGKELGRGPATSMWVEGFRQIDEDNGTFIL
jgi:hypothetical protein